MTFTAPANTNDAANRWRSLAYRLTPGQVECLEAMERHPAYAARPAMVLLEALEFLHPGCVEEYVAGLIAE
jgi:hypothetical protein